MSSELWPVCTHSRGCWDMSGFVLFCFVLCVCVAIYIYIYIYGYSSSHVLMVTPLVLSPTPAVYQSPSPFPQDPPTLSA